ncbi:MAG: hypothetical protein AB8F95_02865 [Bacteroidia bacterium]
MRHFTILTIVLILSLNAGFGQITSLFKDIEFTDSMRMVVMHPHYDDDDTYIEYDLLINKKDVFDSLAPLFTYGKEVLNYFNLKEPTIYILKGTEVIKKWSFNPERFSIRVSGKSYRFNTEMIKELAQKFPLKYEAEQKVFTSSLLFANFNTAIQHDTTFLFMFEPNFDYDGSFKLRFKKNKKFKHPKAISQYLKPLLLEITGEENFMIMYVLDDYNLAHPNQYTMTIKCKQELFEAFKDKSAKKSKWENDIYTATVFRIN